MTAPVAGSRVAKVPCAASCLAPQILSRRAGVARKARAAGVEGVTAASP
jgi:hypothetical protein